MVYFLTLSCSVGKDTQLIHIFSCILKATQHFMQLNWTEGLLNIEFCSLWAFSSNSYNIDGLHLQT